jgi:hypothetical protein
VTAGAAAMVEIPSGCSVKDEGRLPVRSHKWHSQVSRSNLGARLRPFSDVSDHTRAYRTSS